MDALQEERTVYERQARRRGFHVIAGVDEAGRGPLAGPVVAAACILPEEGWFKEIDDSKRLSPTVRCAVFQKILAVPQVEYGIGIVDALLIDQLNILQATFQAMLIAVAHLKQRPDYLLIDGDKLPSTSIPAEAIIQGDRLSVSVAAASVIAKKTRDDIMCQYHERWPEYGFDKHKGYGTKEHLEALRKWGPSPIHRMSFKPVKSVVVN